jgi:hypothetical protein
VRVALGTLNVAGTVWLQWRTRGSMDMCAGHGRNVVPPVHYPHAMAERRGHFVQNVHLYSAPPMSLSAAQSKT